MDVAAESAIVAHPVALEASEGFLRTALQRLGLRNSNSNSNGASSTSDAVQSPPPPFQLLHRLPAELRLRIFEMAIEAATPAPTGFLGRVNTEQCRCCWLAKPYDELQRGRGRWQDLVKPGLEGLKARKLLARMVIRRFARSSGLAVVVKEVLWPGDGKVVVMRSFAERANIPFLALDKHLAIEAMDVLCSVKHLWLTSREALDLSKRAAVVSRLHRLTISERNPKECIFTNDCHGHQVATLQLMLSSLLSGNRLEAVVLRLEAFYGRRVQTSTRSCRKQGIDFLLTATELRVFTTWQCTSIGLYAVDSIRHPCSDAHKTCHCTPAELQLQDGRLRKLHLVHSLVRQTWIEARAAPDRALEWSKEA
ncbi:hypothetical protein LTR08_000828 [Meristemomyces frigidus]|nr:hypothetical protein LTR08_000828 [Meristemomyces frigidus]